MKIDLNKLIEIYEKEVSINTKNKNKVYQFDKYKMSNISLIKYEIENDIYSINKYHIFYIFEPKLRIIMSLDIKDRIVDHYIAKYILLPKVEKYLDIRNVASRKNMGMSYGIKLLKKYIEKNKKYNDIYVLKLDIRKYFYSISHNILKSMLKDILDEDEYKLVCIFIDSTDLYYVNEKIIDIKNNLIKRSKSKKQIQEITDIVLYSNGYGLTIGNVCSQILSIYYLSRIDKYIINNLGCKYMVRYCDDIIILHNNKEYLKEVYSKIEELLNSYELKLNKKKCFISNLKDGCIFCGNYIKIDNNKTIINKCNKSIYKIYRNINKKYKLYKNNKLSFRSYFCSYSSYNI